MAESGPALPLSGIRVLELGTVVAVPYAAMLLQCLGAQVTKVEPVGAGDPLRSHNPLMFDQLNSGKSIIQCDLKAPQDLDRLRVLVGDVDVMLTSGRTGWLEPYGLDGKSCAAINPNLVYCALTGFGSVGPYADDTGFDVTAQAVAGMLTPILRTGNPVHGIPAVTDSAAALATALAAVSGVVGKLSQGRTFTIETSVLEAAVALSFDGVVLANTEADAGWFDRSRPGTLIFAPTAKDGRRILLMPAYVTKFFVGLMEIIDRPDLAADPRFSSPEQRMANYDSLREAVDTAFTDKPSGYWREALRSKSIPHALANEWDQVLHDEQVVALELFGDGRLGADQLFRGPWRVEGRRPPREQG